MSRSKKVERIESPAKFRIFFNGKTGKISYKENEEFVQVPLPFRFVVLDADCKSIGGKTSQAKDAKEFVSNMVHPNYGKQIYHVKLGGMLVKSGKWKDLKGLPEMSKAKNVSTVFGLGLFGENWEIFTMKLHGRSLSSFIETSKMLKEGVYGPYVFSVVGFETKSSEENNTESEVPIFSAIEINANDFEGIDLSQMAMIADTEWVQPYLLSIMGEKPKTEKIEDFDDDKAADASKGDDLPF